MVEISDRSFGYGFVTAAGVRQGARALADVGAAAGQKVELTQANVRTQANKVNGLAGRVAELAVAANGIEEARGVVRSQELSASLQLATRRAVNRMLQAEAQVNARISDNATLSIGGGAKTIAEALAAGGPKDGFDAAFARVLTAALGGVGARQPKVTPIQIIATAASAARKQGDIFDRTMPTRVEAGGRATVEVNRRSIEAQEDKVIIDPNDENAFIPIARIVGTGPPRSNNEGFVITARTGDLGGMVALDLNDPAEEDTRLATVDIEGGEGSDVVFLSGANDARIRVGAGNDFVVADGNTQIFAGAGDDVAVGNYVYGEDGNDVLFGNTLAMGGAGDDRITMFALDPENAPDGLAFGGEGNDIIIGDSRINADGGEGDDAITLRLGGFANGGAGNDTISAFDTATVEGGEGNDDIFMLGGGQVDSGAGDDSVTTTMYTTVKGGKGNDVIRMNAGGILQFAKGDGVDSIQLGATTSGRIEDWGKTNRIELSGFSRDDVEIRVGDIEIVIVSRDPAVRDRLTITRSVPGDAVDIVFTKDDKTQTLSLQNGKQTLGALTNVVSP